MAVENKIKKKLKKIEQLRNDYNKLQAQKEDLENAIKVINNVCKDIDEEIFKVEDYFVEHYASVKSYVVELVKGELIEVLIAHHGTTTFAIHNGLICTAKLHPDDEYNPNVGETIAVQKLTNKLLSLKFGVEF